MLKSYYLQGFIHPKWLAGFLPSWYIYVNSLLFIDLHHEKSGMLRSPVSIHQYAQGCI